MRYRAHYITDTQKALMCERWRQARRCGRSPNANDQRKVIYQQRNDILEAPSLLAQIASLRRSTMEDVVRTYVPAESVEEQWDLKGLERTLSEEWQVDIFLTALVEKSDS